MFLFQVSLLALLCFINIELINSSCQNSFVVICDNLSDVPYNPKRKTWSELLIQQKDYNDDKPRYTLTSLQLNRDLSNLKWLIIIQQLSQIQKNAFTYCKNLQQLILYGNNLPTIKKQTFVGFRNLLKLALENNNIDHLEKNAFVLSTIEVLDLSYNQIQLLPTDLFKKCKITTLKITNNRLWNVELYSLPRDLKNLHLDGNSLNSLPQEINNLKQLEELTVSNNKLDNVPNLDQLTSLKKLDLSFNGIQTVSSEFNSLRNLKYLDLSSNKIEKFIFTTPFIQNIKDQFFLLLAHNKLRNLDLRRIQNTEITTTLFGNPWNCKCMDAIFQLIRNHNITTTACDSRIFAAGKNPYCIVDDNPSCSEEKIPNYVLDNFVKACNDSICDIFNDIDIFVK
ncbi:hypothetical protein Zmor_023129 [Zophobas morio]|uniref:Uncharacterized protein n=1 Tax=Zophobas morio TaxID=2755281 RepID=A0AA38I2M9_9CUCU|nr:hypothetical protein Zmor_023129 [Zophobas morio]